MGTCPCFKSKQPAPSHTVSLLNSALISNDSFNSFRSDSDNKFYGYPKHKELTERLFQIQNTNSSWAIYERDLMINKQHIQNYQQFITDVQNQLVNVITNGLNALQQIRQTHLYLDNMFKSDLQHSFLLEIQDLIIEDSDLKDCSLMMSFSLINEPFKINRDFTTETHLVKQKKISYNYYQQIILDTLDKEGLKNGEIGPPRDFFNKFIFTVQLFKQVNAQYTKLGSQNTFSLIEISDQQIHEKILQLKDDKGKTIGRAYLRFQLLFNLNTFLKYWAGELEIRQDQIDRILRKTKDHDRQLRAGSDNGADGNFHSLMDSNNQIRNESRNETVYEMPFNVK